MKQFFALFFLIFLIFSSCAARIDGSLSGDGSAVLSVSMSLEPRITSLIRSLSAAGGQAGGNILDGNVIAQSMSGAPGIASVTFRNTAPASIEGQIKISNVNEFLTAADRGFIIFEQSRQTGRCEISINRANGPVLLELLSSDISDYLNALMAPIASGEEMTKLEYLELVASFYNKTISDEIASSKVAASVEFPGNITSVKGGTFSGKKASFNIPLLDLLVLETPLVYEVRWNLNTCLMNFFLITESDGRCVCCQNLCKESAAKPASRSSPR